MWKTVLLTIAFLFVSWLSLAPGPPAPPGTGTWISTGNAPSGNAGDRDEVTPGDFGTHSPGALTVTNVSVNGTNKVKGVDYNVSGDGTSDAKIQFLPGKEPPAGSAVEVSGTCTNSNHSPYSGTNTFS